MYTNSSCTLYLKSLNYEKVTIPKAFITQRSAYTLSKLGLSYTEACFCMFNKHDDLVFTPGDDLMVEGNCDITIDTTDEKSISESMESLRKANAVTIMEGAYKKYGSLSMRHWELSCK